MENSLNMRLSIPVDSLDEHATIFMPKPGKGLITKEEDIYNKANIYVSGVFNGKDQLNNYIIAPIGLTEQLLNIPQNSAYQIVIKLKDPSTADVMKDQLQKQFGKTVEIKTKSEENAAFWKMINTEKMMVYLIFGLVIFITTFNLAGAIIILQLDKKAQAKSLISLGLPLSHLRQTYFFTGILITVVGIISGLILGTLICYIQIYTGVFKATQSLPFPVNIKGINYLTVAGTAAFFGFTVSYLFSKINKDYITKN
jgi:lipoprotein-releasing system permease protein